MDFLSALTRLNVARRHGRFSPHKPVLLLAVMDLAIAGKLDGNRIVLNPPLLARYRDYWDAVAEEGDQPSPFLPFFHLRSEPFWTLHALSGADAVLAAMRSANSVAELQRTVAHASLSAEAFACLSDPAGAEQAARLVISHWFSDKPAVLAVWECNRSISQYEYRLEHDDPAVADEAGAYAAPVRSAAFRRVVLDAYDYRCAASGWRFMLDDWYLVEAAHIVPFSETGNDSPRNGIALSPTFHRLMDRGIIAPGPDYRWHVSKIIDRRIADNGQLLELEGAELLLPRDQRWHPSTEYLEARVAKLL